MAQDTPDHYIAQLPEEKQSAMKKLRQVILANLPDGFVEEMSYGMISYVVPHTLYPAGYHSAPHMPLPFMSIAAQKNHFAIYHFGIYANPELMKWYLNEYPKHILIKPDLGKSCIRFKKADHIPYQLIGELAAKMTVEHWVGLYESTIRR
jgi:uncharacterized protein YdhG (YjbR/CyaY superfamily)